MCAILTILWSRCVLSAEEFCRLGLDNVLILFFNRIDVKKEGGLITEDNTNRLEANCAIARASTRARRLVREP
jgi:hypothetical protein